MTELLLIDLSSVAHPIFHASGNEQMTNPNHVSQATVDRVRRLASSHAAAAICCDSGKSFRSEVDQEYKANRDREHSAAIHHQIDLAIETLRNDGFPVWSAKGFEADDVICSAAHLATRNEDPESAEYHMVLVVSSDKDLLALVNPRVSVKSLTSGAVMDEAGVVEKFGVRPQQMTDYLALVGDASDNINGAKGIGPKNAAELLKTYPTLDFLYQCIDEGTAKLTPGVSKSLAEFRPRMDTVRSLVRMRQDVPLPEFADAFKQRVPRDAEDFGKESEMSDETGDLFGQPEAKPEPESNPLTEKSDAAKAAVPLAEATVEPEPQAVQRYETLPAQSRYELQLDPRSYREAVALAKDLHTSRMFGGYGSPAAIMSTILVGRELGLPAGVSLRSIFCVEGRHTISAQLMVALILKSGLAEYFRPVSFDATQATWETKRKGDAKPIILQHTIEMAVIAGVVKEKSNWVKVPVDMLNARASSRLARMAFPDLMAGMWTPEELKESAE